MKVAVIGSGGREHALLRALYDSTSDPDCYVWPGNDGMLDLAEQIQADEQDDCLDELESLGIDLCVIGPEGYLEDGFAARCRQRGVPCWGPGADAAKLETSKHFAKQFMNRHDIPTGGFTLADSPDDIRSAVENFPVALKFNGLAGGKGVTVAFQETDVEDYIQEVYEEERFGPPEPVLVEEFLDGVELTVICAVTDGDYQIYAPSRDYKPLENGDEGPNTGGMGAVSSHSLINDDMLGRVERDIIRPTVNGLEEEGLSYRGFLYFGLMLTDDGPRILEYNCRFGDPEAQATLPLLEGDFAGYLHDAARGDLQPAAVSFRDGWSVCTMFASENYPYSYSHGQTIHGLDEISNARVYFSGVRAGSEGGLEVDGGRILGVVAVDDQLESTREKVYENVNKIEFEGMHYRTDIAQLHFEDSNVLSEG